MLHSINREGLLVDVSNMWLEKLGYERDEVIGRPSIDFLTEESRRYARDVVLPRFFETGRCVVEYEMVRKDGTTFPVRLRGEAERDETGAVIASAAAIEDLTEQRLLESRMVQAQKLESLGLMAGGIAHDFNNLLVSILGNAELAIRELRDQTETRRFVEDVVVAARRAADLCQQLLAYSGRSRMRDVEVDLSELVREVAQMLDVTVGRDAIVKLDLADGCVVVGDATELRQVVMNLVLNAREALEGRGLINLSTSIRTLDDDLVAESSNAAAPPGRYVCVEIADTGAGIPDAVRDRIFDPFFTTKSTGHGLGLAAVHGIVRAHHGTISVTSSVGRGTTFRVYLPLGAERSEHAIAVPTPHKKTLLIVDDNESVRKTLSLVLVGAGYQVMSAENGEEAMLIVRARGEEIDACLIDVSMPQMSGVDLFDQIREVVPDAVVIMMSGFERSNRVREATSRGLAGYLRKPFLAEDFEGVLEKLLEERRKA